MIETGRIPPNATEVVWTSDPLPNDALVVREGPWRKARLTRGPAPSRFGAEGCTLRGHDRMVA
jgi:hypothetical protein